MDGLGRIVLGEFGGLVIDVHKFVVRVCCGGFYFDETVKFRFRFFEC